MPPTLANGKICYIEMPATDIARSADFYQRVFGWNVRKRGDGSTAFDDTTGEVSGAWVIGRPPAAKPGLLFYVMVDSVAATLDVIVANGGEIVQPIGARRARDHCQVPRSSRKHNRPLPATRVTEHGSARARFWGGLLLVLFRKYAKGWGTSTNPFRRPM